jgi:hypothetical protein
LRRLTNNRGSVSTKSWELHTQYPHVPREAKIVAARDVVRSLVENSALNGFRTVWASNDFQPISSDELLAAIDDARAWSDPTEEPYLCVAAV